MLARHLVRVCLALCLGIGAACSKPKGDEAQIRHVIEEAISAANNKDARGVLENASDNFTGPSGWDRRECLRALYGRFLSAGAPSVSQKNIELKIEGSAAHLKLDLSVSDGPVRSALLSFDLALAKTDNRWLLTSATYTRK